MLKKIDSNQMGSNDLGWLKSKYHFSFASYHNPSNINFGTLRVLNDDLVEPGHGFEMHPHKDMEIISYVVEGELTHEDNLGNRKTLGKGEVQYMSAGKGVMHSEHNFGSQTLRLLQLWIIPDNKGYQPNYGDYKYNWEDRENKWLQIISSQMGSSPIKINQDSNIFVVELDKDKEIDFPVGKGRQVYLVQIEGTSEISNIVLNSRDALEIIEEDIKIRALETSHLMIIEMKR